MLVWSAILVVMAVALGVALGERALMTRLAADRRAAGVQVRVRRAGLWLLALVQTGVAQVAVVLAIPLAGQRWAGTATASAWLVTAVAGGAGVAALVTLAARRDRRPVIAVLVPGLVTAAAQEVVFRGALPALLVVAGVPLPPALAVAAVAFAATRLTRGTAAAIAALVTGLALGAAVWATGTVLVAVVLHAGALALLAALDRSTVTGLTSVAAAATAAAATPGIGCGSHDPSAPACLACPLAPARATVAA